MKYSVLMSVYKKENPAFFRLSIESMLNQTFPPDEFVLVCDGALTQELDSVIYEFSEKFHDFFRIIRLKENKGLGYALRVGVVECKNELIARMDSDDVSKPNRCEIQINYFKKHPNVGIIGGYVEEFSDSVHVVESIRCVPEHQKEIIKFIKKRNPFNHPSVMFRKSSVLSSGNYKNVRYMQDYFLWVDMLSSGVQGYNIPTVLVSMRAGSNLFKRRSGIQYLRIQKNLLQYMKEKKIINSFEFLVFLILRTISSLSPNWIRKVVFKKFLRSEANINDIRKED